MGRMKIEFRDWMKEFGKGLVGLRTIQSYMTLYGSMTMYKYVCQWNWPLCLIIKVVPAVL